MQQTVTKYLLRLFLSTSGLSILHTDLILYNSTFFNIKNVADDETCALKNDSM